MLTTRPLEYTIPGIAFDPAEIQRAYSAVLARVPAAPSGRAEDQLRNLGFTHRANAADPWRDAGVAQFDQTGTKRYEEEEFAFFNEALQDTYFYHIYRSLPFRTGRMRLVTLQPNGIDPMHSDVSVVAHIAIVTNEDCRFLYRNGSTYFVPVDGRIRVFDTTQPHSAYNAGRTERVHLTMTVLSDPKPGGLP
jgi:hypothetical protein